MPPSAPLALLLLPLLGCSPVRVARRVVEAQARYEGLAERRMVMGSRQLRYWEGGDGPPLVLLHGFGGDGLLTWSRQVEALLPHRRLIIPDLLWFGDSFALAAEPSLELQARTLWELLDRLGLGFGRTELCGISYGGFVALRMQQARPDNVAALVLVDSPGPVFGPEDVRAMLDRLGVASPEEMFVPDSQAAVARLISIVRPGGPPIPGPILKGIQRVHFGRFPEEHRALLADLLAEQGRWPPDRWVRPARGLVLWGSEDPVFPVESGRRLAEALDMELVVMEGVAHGPNFQRPEEFNARLLAFLTGERDG